MTAPPGLTVEGWGARQPAPSKRAWWYQAVSCR